MKLATVASAILVMATPLAMAQTSTWKTDPNHSEVDFTIKHRRSPTCTGALAPWTRR